MEETAVAGGLPLYDVTFYALAYFLAFTGGILSTFTDNTYRSVLDLLAIGGISGLVSCSCLGVLVGTIGGTVGSEPYYLGLAAGIGLLGKGGLRLVDKLADVIKSKLGISE